MATLLGSGGEAVSFVDFAADALMWIGRAVAVLPAFKALWQAIQGGDADQQFAAQMELTRAIRREQAKAEIEQP